MSGNVIVVAGAGTGKTHTLVQECLTRLDQGVEITDMLIVTFTKAAAAELRERIGRELQKKFAERPESPHLARQIAILDRAQISTLHSFCLELVSRHFSELGLSPRLVTLEASQAAILRNEALDVLFETYYDAKTELARETRRMLIEWFNGDDRAARGIVSDVHAFTQTRPDPAKWFATQRAMLEQNEPALWREWHSRAIEEWVERWRPTVERQPRGASNPARDVILSLMDKFDVAALTGIFNDEELWPVGSKGPYRKPIEKMFEEANVLAGWIRTPASDALLEDWKLVRDVTLRLLSMTEDFSAKYAELKLARGFIDFHDLEQFSLRLLWNAERPSAIAEFWRGRFQWIFVDEYQDINSAQDRIIQALARECPAGNRFLVGDMKQSIYGFRQAEPKIFRDYEQTWTNPQLGKRTYLTANWRSHERILDFVNALFTGLMTGDIGDVVYDENARLAFAQRPDRTDLSRERDSSIKVELHLIAKDGDAGEMENGEETNGSVQDLGELDRTEGEAELIAELCERIVEKAQLMLPTGRRATYEDIVILMRSAASEVEVFAKVFSRRGIPLDARRNGFFDCIEALDLTNLLTILDNPLQDIPLLGVLRSPIGCFTASDLADVRATKLRGSFWNALQQVAGTNVPSEVRDKAREFLAKFKSWRALSRHTSLAERLEIILEETGYEDWAAAQDRGAQRRANIRRVVNLAREFDASRGEGLYPFLQYVEDQAKSIGDIAAPASADARGAVRLMTVHQSKGLQFPIVIMSGLAKKFNSQDFRGIALLDEQYGLCLKARPPKTRRQYETIGFWMARHRQHKRMLDEEMRILYVALTRAQHQLLLVGTPSKKARDEWQSGGKRAAAANCLLDWIGPWLASNCINCVIDPEGEANDWRWKWHRSISPGSLTQEASAEIQNVSPENLVDLKKRLEWKYPFESATQKEAKSSATALRRAIADEPELARPVSKGARPKKGAIGASELGQAAHRFLQHASFESFSEIKSIEREIVRLRDASLLNPDEAAAIAPEKVIGFWQSEFGHDLLQRKSELRRELVFTAKFTRADLQAVGAPSIGDFGGDEFIVVQGAADLVAILPNELWLVDFKTDRIPETLLGNRVKEYSLQLRIYALALSRIYGRPVTRACLHFLEFNRTEWIDLNTVARGDTRPPKSRQTAKQMELF